MAFPSAKGAPVQSMLMREPQTCLGSRFAGAVYRFFVTGTSTPANVYENGALTTPFPITGFVQADSFGRFPAIYLDPSIIYRVQFYDSTNTLRWTVDPYTPPFATTGSSSNVTYGPKIATTGEVSLAAPAAGGTGITLTLQAGALGTAALKISSPVAGQPAIIVNSSATTGAHTATFTANNKPGTATSSPAGWLPIECDGVIYYTPIWHGNNFTPYVAVSGPVGQVINTNNITFNGDGSTSAGLGTANPSSWYLPNATNIGNGFYLSFTKTGGPSGMMFQLGYTASAAPSGAAYTGGTLLGVFSGTTSNTYTIQTSLGQLITGCTFTNGSSVFSCPSTNINGSPGTAINVGFTSPSLVQNITSTGINIATNSASILTGTYTISNSPSGNPVLATGSITLSAIGFGPSGPSWNVTTPLVLDDDGTATANGSSTTAWSNQAPQAGQGANYWINITQTGGTPGYSFSAAAGAWTNISSGGLSVGINGPGGTNYFVTGVYQVALDSAGVYVVTSGNITLNGGSPVQSQNWNGTPTLALLPNGTAFLNGAQTPNWYSPTTPGVGPSYWFGITRTGGTTGVNFTNAQGSFVNIGSGGLTTNIGGYTGDVGSAFATGTWQISNSASGSPILGSGTITLTVTGLTVIHIYTTGTNAFEVVPTGTSVVNIESWGPGGNGSAGTNTKPFQKGSAGGSGAYCHTQLNASTLGGAGVTIKYTIGTAAGVNTVVQNGSSSGLTTMTAGSGNGAGAGPTSPGAGGTASGGNQANTNGTAGSTTGITGVISGDGSPYGGGGTAGLGGPSGGSGGIGQGGAVVFFYT